MGQVCLEGMIKQKYGKIVHITSQSAVIATKAHAACEQKSNTGVGGPTCLKNVWEPTCADAPTDECTDDHGRW